MSVLNVKRINVHVFFTVKYETPWQTQAAKENG